MRVSAHARRFAESIGAAFQVSRDVSDLQRKARRAVDDGVERLVVVGGDGTLLHVGEALAGSDCALGIIPAGTGNDLARSLGIPTDVDSAAEAAVEGAVRSIDIGRIDGRIYLTVAGAGFHGAVASYVADRLRVVRGPLAYPYAVLRTLASYEPPTFRVRYDGGSFGGRAWLVVLANSPTFGGGMRIAPHAELDDGLLDLVIVKNVPRATFLRIFPSVYRGRHTGHAAVVTARTNQATIEIDRPHVYYGDGEPLIRAAAQPVAFGLRPRALRVAMGDGAS